MLVINGKAVLRIGNQLHPPGTQIQMQDALAKKLIDVGLVETAVVKHQTEKAVKIPVKVAKTREAYEAMTKNELVRLLNNKGIEHNKRQVKSELIDLLTGGGTG